MPLLSGIWDLAGESSDFISAISCVGTGGSCHSLRMWKGVIWTLVKGWGTIISSSCWEGIVISPEISVTVPAQGVEIILEKQLWNIYWIKASNHEYEVWPGNTEVWEAEDLVTLETWPLWGFDSLKCDIFQSFQRMPSDTNLNREAKWELRESFQNGNDQVLSAHTVTHK